MFFLCVTLEFVQISKMMYVTMNLSFLLSLPPEQKSLFFRHAFFELMRISAYVRKTKSGGKGLKFKR